MTLAVYTLTGLGAILALLGIGLLEVAIVIGLLYALTRFKRWVHRKIP